MTRCYTTCWDLTDGADAGCPLVLVPQPAAPAEAEPLPGGTGLPVRGDAGRLSARGSGGVGAGPDLRRRRAALRLWADGEPAAIVYAELAAAGPACSAGATALRRTAWTGSWIGRGPARLASELPLALERLVLTVRLLAYVRRRSRPSRRHPAAAGSTRGAAPRRRRRPAATLPRAYRPQRDGRAAAEPAPTPIVEPRPRLHLTAKWLVRGQRR